MAKTLKKLRIFSASPSDVASERAKLETVVESLKPMADYLGLTLEVVDWRAVVPDAGRPQQTIFDQLKPTSWDIFIGILWHRFGTPPGSKDKTGKDYLSGTEEEFKIAYELWKEHGKPRMVLYRCTRALPYDVDPDQLKRVRDFFNLIEDVKGDYPTLYQAFDTAESFEKLLLDNLQKLLIEYGEQSNTPITPETVQVLAPTIPNNLPRRAAFFGRAKEMETVMRALSPDDRTWGVLVDGIGGIGKTAIAIEASYRAQEAGAFEAFVFVTAKQNILDPSGIRELTPPAQTLDEFLNETTRVLGQSGIAKLTGSEKRGALVDVLRSTRTLLIYDNLETLSKEEQEGIADFLRELPQGCKAIVTSRRRGGEGGVWLRVEKLDWDAAYHIIENQVKRDAGLASKLNSVGEARWQELYDETNGSPLALVHTLGLMRVRAALTFDGALEMLRGNRDEDLQKFIFQEAHKELTENDKVALGALSFFVPSATFEVWKEVAELSRNTLETAIDHLSALSLVDVMAGEERYALHPLTRVFVHDKLLVDAKLAREMGMRFIQQWVDYSEQHGGSGRNYANFIRLEAEWSNLDATADWLWKTANVKGESVGDENAARLLNNLGKNLRSFYWFNGRWNERVLLCKHAYEAMRALKDWNDAGMNAYWVAFVHYYRSQTNEATLWANRCAEAASKLEGKKHIHANSAQIRGLVAQQREKYTEAGRFLRKALTIRRNLGSKHSIAIGLRELGKLAHERKDYRTAEKWFSEALELVQAIKDKELQVVLYGDMGELAISCKQWVDARKWFNKALSLAKKVGRQDSVARAQYGLARIEETKRRVSLALSRAENALKIYELLQTPELTEVREFVERVEKKINVEG